MTHQDLWYIVKIALGGEFISLIRIEEKLEICDLHVCPRSSKKNNKLSWKQVYRRK